MSEYNISLYHDADTHELSVLINLNKLRAGDNQEWEFLLKKVQRRLQAYSYSITGKWRYCEDIVANAIADLWASIGVIESNTHVMGFLFEFVRFESLQWSIKGPGRFVLDDNITSKIDWFLHYQQLPTEELNMDLRRELDNWKDDMLNMIREESNRLPRRWAMLVRSYLVYRTRSEFSQHSIANGYSKDMRVSSFDKIKRLVNHRLSGSSNIDRMTDLRMTLRYLNNNQKKAILIARQSGNVYEAANRMGVKYNSYRHHLRKAVEKIQEVWIDPLMGNMHSHLLFINSIVDPEVIKIIDEEIVNNPKNRLRSHVRIFNKEERRQIVLLRDEQKIEWGKIASIMHARPNIIKETYEMETGRKAVKIIGKRPDSSLTADNVVEMRRLYSEGGWSHISLADRYGITRTTVSDILNHKIWKNAESRVGEIHARDKLSEISGLHKDGFSCVQIAEELGCKVNAVRYQIRKMKENLKDKTVHHEK